MGIKLRKKYIVFFSKDRDFYKIYNKDISKLKGQSGIYIIFHREEGRNSILDVGESKDVKKKFGQNIVLKVHSL